MQYRKRSGRRQREYNKIPGDYNRINVKPDEKYEISASLMLLYDYMLRRLIDANLQKSSEILDEILEFAKELRDTWDQAMKIAKTGKEQCAGCRDIVHTSFENMVGKRCRSRI